MGDCLQHHLCLWVSRLPRALLAAEDGVVIHVSPHHATASPPPDPPPRSPSTTVSTFRPSVAIIVGILTTMFSVTFLLLLYAKHCRRTAGAGRPYGGRGGAVAGFLGSGPNPSGRRNSGVDRAVVESLPVFRFGSLRGRKQGLECAVCLCRFEGEELLRLLPKCKHAFHVECVDTWLDAHSTCPLCRHRVDPEDVLLAFHEYEPPAGPKPHPSDAEGSSFGSGRPSKSDEVPAPTNHPTTSTAAKLGFFRAGRLSGRHSSAGEKCSGSALQVIVHRASSDEAAMRKSLDNVLMLRGAAGTARRFDGGGARKDGLLPLAENNSTVATGTTQQQRFGHQIVVSGEGEPEGPILRRWSDIRPQDLLFLRREMILAGGGGGRCSVSQGRASSCSCSSATSGGLGVRGSLVGSRSVSEITGLSRFAPGGLSSRVTLGRTEEELAVRRWLAVASKRAARWLGRGGGEPNGP